ncbi:hypothetical protein A5698_15885 [Mycobacterium sp. E136]|nr:hypothetical protein A5698_15885 [Mycobacterium sp. E136]
MTWGDDLRNEVGGNGTRVTSAATLASVGERVGSFRYFRAQDRWEWSDTVAQMHGYPPGEAQPSTSLVSHKHPDDAASVALLIETVTGLLTAHRRIGRPGGEHSNAC